eukprot:6187134-Pleurochrysis_carterae.AAC.2
MHENGAARARERNSTRSIHSNRAQESTTASGCQAMGRSPSLAPETRLTASKCLVNRHFHNESEARHVLLCWTCSKDDFLFSKELRSQMTEDGG